MECNSRRLRVFCAKQLFVRYHSWTLGQLSTWQARCRFSQHVYLYSSSQCSAPHTRGCWTPECGNSKAARPCVQVSNQQLTLSHGGADDWNHLLQSWMTASKRSAMKQAFTWFAPLLVASGMNEDIPFKVTPRRTNNACVSVKKAALEHTPRALQQKKQLSCAFHVCMGGDISL